MKRRLTLAVVGLLALLALACATNKAPSADPTPPPPLSVTQAADVAKQILFFVCPELQDPLPIVRACVTIPLVTMGHVPTVAAIKECVLEACHLATAPPPPPTTPRPTQTLAPTSATAPATAKPSPTAAVGLVPPTFNYFNGCDAGNPRSVNPATGDCEFNSFQVVKISNPAFTPSCDPGQCPNLWRPSGMALACDHMYTEPNAPGGIYEPKVGKWVSIMWYVCAGRLWDFPGNIEIRAAKNGAPDFQSPPLDSTSQPVQWTARSKRTFDGYNGTIAGHGLYYVCIPFGAYTCKDENDLTGDQHDEVYTTGVCPSGNVLLPVAQRCVGPYRVDR